MGRPRGGCVDSHPRLRSARLGPKPTLGLHVNTARARPALGAAGAGRAGRHRRPLAAARTAVALDMAGAALLALGAGLLAMAWRRRERWSGAAAAGRGRHRAGLCRHQWPRRLAAGRRPRAGHGGPGSAGHGVSSASCRAARWPAHASCLTWRKRNSGRTPCMVPPRLALGWYRGWTRMPCSAGRRKSCAPGSAGSCRRACVGRMAPFNPHGFDLELWLFEQGIGASGYVRSRPGASAFLLDPQAGRALQGARQDIRDAIARARGRPGRGRGTGGA
jgi:hypothetical protein